MRKRIIALLLSLTMLVPSSAMAARAEEATAATGQEMMLPSQEEAGIPETQHAMEAVETTEPQVTEETTETTESTQPQNAMADTETAETQETMENPETSNVAEDTGNQEKQDVMEDSSIPENPKIPAGSPSMKEAQTTVHQEHSTGIPKESKPQADEKPKQQKIDRKNHGEAATKNRKEDIKEKTQEALPDTEAEKLPKESGKKGKQKADLSGQTSGFVTDVIQKTTENPTISAGNETNICEGFLADSGSFKLHIQTLGINGNDESTETYTVTISGIDPENDGDGNVSVAYDVKSNPQSGTSLAGIAKARGSNGVEFGTVQGWSNDTYAYCYKNNKATIGYCHTGKVVCANCMITSDGSHRYKTYKYGVFLLELTINQPAYTYLTTGPVKSAGGRRLNFKQYPGGKEGWAGTSITSLNSNGVPTTSGQQKILLQVHAANLGRGSNGEWFWDDEAVEPVEGGGEITLQIVPVTAAVGHSSLLPNSANTINALEANADNQAPGIYFDTSYSAANIITYPIQNAIQIGKNHLGNPYSYHSFAGYTPIGWSAYNSNGQAFYSGMSASGTNFALLGQWPHSSWNGRFTGVDPGPDKGNVGSIVFYTRYRHSLFTNRYYLQLYSADLAPKMGISNPYAYGNQTIRSWNTQVGARKSFHVQFLDHRGRQIPDAQQELRLPFLGWYLSGANKHLTIPTTTAYETQLLTEADVSGLSITDGATNNLHAQWGAVDVTPQATVTDPEAYERHAGKWEFAYYHVPTGLEADNSTFTWSEAVTTRRSEFPAMLTNGSPSTFGTGYDAGIPTTLRNAKHLSAIENSTNVYYRPVMEEIPLKLVYRGNGGTLADGSASRTDTETWTKSATKEITLDQNSFRKTGYYFAGWKFSDGSEKAAGDKAAPAFLNENSGKASDGEYRVVHATAIWKPIVFTVAYYGGEYETAMKLLNQKLYGQEEMPHDAQNAVVMGATHIRNGSSDQTDDAGKTLGVNTGDGTETPGGWTELSRHASGLLSGTYHNGTDWVRGMADSTHTYGDGSKITPNDYVRRPRLSLYRNMHADEASDLYLSEYWNLPFYRWFWYATGVGASGFVPDGTMADGLATGHMRTGHGKTANLVASFSAKKISLPARTRDGYRFLGWDADRTTATASAVDYPFDEATGKITKTLSLTEDTVLYAIWEAKRYPITYHGNGGSWGPGEVTRGDVKVWDRTYYFREKESLTNLEWEQALFLGWSTDPDASEPEYLPGEAFEDADPSHYDTGHELRLYAVWLPSIRVSYLNNTEAMGRDPGATYETYGRNRTDTGEGNKDIPLMDAYTMYGNQAEENQIPEDLSDPRNPKNPLGSPSNHGKNFAMEGTYQYLDSNGEEQEETVTATVVAWSFDPEADTESPDLYKMGEELEKGRVLYEKALELGGDALTKGNPRQEYFQAQSHMEEPEELAGGENTLYANLFAVYDYGPKLHGDDLYYTLEYARNGNITMEDILSHVEVFDTEDGTILEAEEIPAPADRQEDTTYYTVMDYQPEDFTQLTGDARMSVTYLGVDSAGNITRKRINITIVDVDISIRDADPRKGEARFISYQYLWTLDPDSIWLTEPYFSSLVSSLHQEEVDAATKAAYPHIYNASTEAKSLRKTGADMTPDVPIFGDLFRKEIRGTSRYSRAPLQVWVFTKEEVDRVKEFVESTGFTTYADNSQLNTFLGLFDQCHYYSNGSFRHTGTVEEPDFYRRWFSEELGISP